MKSSRYLIWLQLITLSTLLSACSHTGLIRFSSFPEDTEKLAATGNRQSGYHLATIKEEGAGVPKDIREAVQWYRRSAAQQDPDALFELARLMIAEQPVARDDAEAVKLLFNAGSQGNERAQSLLALLSIAGRGRDEFNSQVRKARRGADSGDPTAQYTMGWIYYQGAGLHRSAPDAVKWLTKSARQGHLPAARLMGDIILNGDGVQKNQPLALRWYDSAAAAGDRQSAARIEQLRRQDFPGISAIKTRPQKPLSDSARDFHKHLIRQLDCCEKDDPVSALRTARRLVAIDPLDKDSWKTLERIRTENPAQSDILISQALIVFKESKNEVFHRTINKIIMSEFNERRLYDMVLQFWHINEEANRAANEIIRNLETVAATDPEKINQPKLNRQIATFRELIAEGFKRKPGDQVLSSISNRGEQIIADIQVKIAESKENPQDLLFSKGIAMLSNGQFVDAAKTFERLARTPGYPGIALAYVYQGIANLAQINPSNVSQAKRLRLKGIAYFQNALRFDREITLPDGYTKYTQQFEEARKQLNH